MYIVNNKGQTLIVFIILLPIVLLLLIFIVDYGLLSIEKRKINNNTYDALEYYLNNIDKSNVKTNTIKLIEANLDNVEIEINDELDYVEIIVKSSYKSLYNSLMNGELTIKYKGIKASKEIVKG